MFKNVGSQKWLVFAFYDGGGATSGAPVTGDAANITAKIRQDYGAASAVGDTNPTEIEDGYYEFDLTQAETNGDVLDILPESSTANVQVVGVPGRIFTRPQNWPDVGIETNGEVHADVKTNSDKTGYKLASDGLDQISVAEPSGVPSWGGATVVQALAYVTAFFRNKITQTSSTQALRNDADNADIVSASVSDDGTTATRGEFS